MTNHSRLLPCQRRDRLDSTSKWTKLRDALRREKRDLDDAVGELQDRANSVLNRKERELAFTPVERLAIEQDRARSVDDRFEAVCRRSQGMDRS